MDQKKRSFVVMEKYITIAIMAGCAFFLLFLTASGYGILWLKIICAIFSILIPLLCFLYLLLIKELHKRRSQWMIAASAALILCTLFSLILSYPSPAP